MFAGAPDKEHQSGRRERGRAETKEAGSAQGTSDEYVQEGEETSQENVPAGQRAAGNEGGGEQTDQTLQADRGHENGLHDLLPHSQKRSEFTIVECHFGGFG